MQRAMTMGRKGRENGNGRSENTDGCRQRVVILRAAQAAQIKENTKREGEKETTSLEVVEINIIQFVTLKEKRRVLNVIPHVSDLGSAVYHLKFCVPLEKICTY